MARRKGSARGQGKADGSGRGLPQGMYPNPTTTLVGRDREVAEIAELLQSSRLVTLTGQGGSGKTRLAIAVAQDLAGSGGELAFVDLAALDRPEQVMSAILSSLGLRALSDKDPEDLIVERLADETMTLVLDNFEHLTAAANSLSDVLAQCPGLTVLVTSRTRLRLSTERVFEVGPLATPPDSEDRETLQSFASVRLFLDRAADAGGSSTLGDQDLPVVAEICRRLEGLPLAIELAAARARHLSVQALLGRLETPLPLLSGGPIDAPARHRALRHTIAWSYDLLEEDAARFFSDLGAFEGSFGLAGAHHVTGLQETESDIETLDRLTTLADQSLIRAVLDDDGEARFVMHDAVREFAISVAIDEAAARDRHLEYYLRLAERAEPELDRAGQARWTKVLVRDLENLRGALRWAQHSSSTIQLLRLAAALGSFWRFHGDLREGREWLSRATQASQPGHEELTGKAQRGAGRINVGLGDRTQAKLLFEAARRNAEAAADIDGLVISLLGLAEIMVEERRQAEASEFVGQALELARAGATEVVLAYAVMSIATLQHSGGATDEAVPLYAEAIELARRAGNVRLAAVALGNLADIELIRMDYAAAVPLLKEAIEYLGRTGDLAYSPWAHLVLGLALRKLGEMDDARIAIDQGTRLALDVSSPVELIFALEAMADWLGAGGANQEAVSAWASASYAREDLDIPRQPTDDAWINEGIERDRGSLPKSTAEEVWIAARDTDLQVATEAALASLGVVSVATSPNAPRNRHDLTKRETEVLALLVRGQSDGEIADELYISAKTASVHVANIKGKLGASSRVDTVTTAVRMGLVTIPEEAEDLR